MSNLTFCADLKKDSTNFGCPLNRSQKLGTKKLIKNNYLFDTFLLVIPFLIYQFDEQFVDSGDSLFLIFLPNFIPYCNFMIQEIW